MGERLLPFTSAAIERVPHATGAYFLFRAREPVCAAVAAGGATLRSELAARLAQGSDATHFSWIRTADALHAYRLQLAAHARWDVRKAARLPQPGSP